MSLGRPVKRRRYSSSCKSQQNFLQRASLAYRHDDYCCSLPEKSSSKHQQTPGKHNATDVLVDVSRRHPRRHAAPAAPGDIWTMLPRGVTGCRGENPGVEEEIEDAVDGTFVVAALYGPKFVDEEIGAPYFG